MFRDTRIDGIRSVFQFQGVMRQAVHDFKYHNIRILAPVFAAFMADYLQDYPIPAEILIPVPLHPKRLRERGYNQAELIARELSSLSGIPLDTGLLFRRKYTTAQARTTSLEQRRANMIDAFACRQPVDDLTIMLLDDVTTSATTLEACASVLKAAGAKSVWGFTLAREI
jgi:ComF family protein